MERQQNDDGADKYYEPRFSPVSRLLGGNIAAPVSRTHSLSPAPLLLRCRAFFLLSGRSALPRPDVRVDASSMLASNTLYLVLFDGEVEVLFNARAEVSDGILRCLDSGGRELRRYDSKTVLMYSYNERVKDLASALFDAAA